MAYQGDVEIIHNWREEHSIEDLQRIVERKGYSAISVGSFDHAALKKFPYQLTADHCEPSPGYSNTLYIWNGRGGGSGALGIISSVQPADADEDEDEDEDWDEGGGACMAWGYQSEDQLACYGSVSGMTYDLDHPCWHELDANPTCCNYCGPWTSSEYESTCSALDIIRVSAGCCFSVQDSSGTEHHYDQDQNFCYNGVGCDSVRSVKVYDCSGGDEDEEPGEGSGGSLGKVEVGRVMSWYDYRARAKQEGGRLPTTAELRAAGVDVGYDQWTPITPSPGDQETGRRDGARGKDENAWANIGPRKYQIEYPAWGLDASEHPWKRLTYFYVVSESGAPRIIDSRLVLVRRGSPNVLRFDHWQALQAGGAAPLTCHASHPGNGIDFRVNSDGSICLVNHPHLCLGVIDFESQARLFRWRRWLSKVLVTREGVCSNDWPESPGDYPYEAFANSGKCRGGDFDEDVGTVADIGECWSRCQDLNEPEKTSYCASMHQTSMECSCQGADPDGDFDELECLEDVGEYTLAVHEGWRGSRCAGKDGRVCACDGGDYCLPRTLPHMAELLKKLLNKLLDYAFLAIGFSLLLGPGVSLTARVGLCWVAIPGFMALVGGSIAEHSYTGDGSAVFFWTAIGPTVGIIVYRCIGEQPLPESVRDEIAGRAGDDDDASLIASKPEDKEKWCADVVARIEAIESTIQVMQTPPPRHDSALRAVFLLLLVLKVVVQFCDVQVILGAR